MLCCQLAALRRAATEALGTAKPYVRAIDPKVLGAAGAAVEKQGL